MSRGAGGRFEQELAGAAYEPLPSLPEADPPPALDLIGGEAYEWAAIPDLDGFFRRVYRYWHDKGLVCILVGRLLNLGALAFTIAFSGFLLLAVNWSALHAACLLPHDPGHSCDLLAVALHAHPWRDHSRGLVLLVGTYLLLCGLYWGWSAAQLAAEARDVIEVKHFVNNKLGISDRQVRMMTWSELLHRLVAVQATSRLCAAKDLDELDIVGRIMRKENYLIGMLNAGVLGLHVPRLDLPAALDSALAAGGLDTPPALRRALGSRAVARLGSVLAGGRRRFLLTKTLEWNLYLCVLDPMFDENFHVRQDFLCDERRLRARLRAAAAINAALSPFLLLFLVIYFFMKNAERFYHSPGNLGSRRWSSLAKWRLRELNELPHYIQHRLDASYEAAVKYVGQFPSPLLSQVAKFVSFVAGSFAALLLVISLLDENLLEVPMAGRNLVWWLALTGILLTISRSFINDTPVAFDPERAMAELVLHTHYLPRHWRGRAHSAEVQQSVSSMFTFKVLLFAEELASVVLTPFILAFSLPNCAGAILQFVRDTTTRVEGVGDVCSLAVFDFSRHGNSKYGAPTHAAKHMRSKQGKMEKSFLTFVATYPTWQPPPACRQVLTAIGGSVSSAAGAGGLGGGGAMGAHGGAAGAACGGGGGGTSFGLGSPWPFTSAGAGAGLGPPCGGAADAAAPGAAGGESVLWQQPGHTFFGGGSSAQQSSAGAGAAAGGSSSVWVGVAADAATPGPRAANARQQQQHHQAGQQREAGQQQQQQQTTDGDVMGAGLGGLGSSPADRAAVLQDAASAAAAGGHTDQQQQQHEYDAFGDDLFQPLSPTEAAGAAAAAPVSPLLAPGGGYGAAHRLLPAAGAAAGDAVLSPRALQQQRQAARQQQQRLPQQLQHQQQHQQPLGRQQLLYHQQQQHQMLLLQLSQYSSLLPGIGLQRGMHPQPGMLPPFPSTLYPGGPSAAAGLSHHLQHPALLMQQQQQPRAPGGGPAPPPYQQQQHIPPALPPGAPSMLAASLLAGGGGSQLVGSDFLPTNEREELSSRVAASQSLLQSYYESQDLSVQHRQANRAHARSVLLGQTGTAAAAMAAAMAAAASVRLEHM